MSEEQFQTLLNFFKVLGNESRLKILGLLANEERSVGDLAALLELKEPTVSHHLAAMKKLGLVKVRAEGNNRIYRLNVGRLEEMNKDIFSQESLATLVDDAPTDRWKQRVLQTCLDGERIVHIPSKRKKRFVLLQWLANRFEMGMKYPEPELNRILKQYNEDTASLRRYMVEEKLMAREGGVYWRLPAKEFEA